MSAIESIREKFNTGELCHKKASDICRLLGAGGKTERESVLRLLKELESDGEIVRDDRGRYVLPAELRLIKGVIQGNERGFAFLVREEGDLFLPHRSLHGALHGDTVLCRLVGGEGFVPGYSDGADHLAYGEEGVLTDPASDAREWLSCHLYADGEIVFTLDDEPEAGRSLCMSGRMCATARYQAIDARAWEGAEVDVLKATFSADLSSLDFVNLSYWFYGDGELSEVVGLSNLPAVREMRYAFCSCDSLVEIDLSGFPTGELEDVFYCFSGCGSLTTIWADADWALPAGCTGSGAFYNCTSLVGGAGTTYSSSRISATYMRIDGVGGAGYLTAKGS